MNNFSKPKGKLCMKLETVLGLLIGLAVVISLAVQTWLFFDGTSHDEDECQTVGTKVFCK